MLLHSVRSRGYKQTRDETGLPSLCVSECAIVVDRLDLGSAPSSGAPLFPFIVPGRKGVGYIKDKGQK